VRRGVRSRGFRRPLVTALNRVAERYEPWPGSGGMTLGVTARERGPDYNGRGMRGGVRHRGNERTRLEATR
jgi:hypothetical protein